MLVLSSAAIASRPGGLLLAQNDRNIVYGMFVKKELGLGSGLGLGLEG